MQISKQFQNIITQWSLDVSFFFAENKIGSDWYTVLNK